MLHMLFVLNHHRLGDTVRSQQSLQDLHTLLLYDDEGAGTSTRKRHILADTGDLSRDLWGLYWGSELISVFSSTRSLQSCTESDDV